MAERIFFDNRHLKGTAVKDGEIRHTKDGKPITSFCIAINYSEKINDKWEKIHADFINCSYFDKANIHKGDSVEVKGYMSYRKYNEKVYNKFTVQEIIGQSANNAQSNDGWDTPPAPDFDDDSIPF